MLIYRDGISYTSDSLLGLMGQVYSLEITEDRKVKYTPRFCKPYYTCSYSDEFSYYEILQDAAKDILKTAKENGWVLFKEII